MGIESCARGMWVEFETRSRRVQFKAVSYEFSARMFQLEFCRSILIKINLQVNSSTFISVFSNIRINKGDTW